MTVRKAPLPRRPLLACYGGGHAQIISILAKALIAEGVTPRIIGFTTAYRALKLDGLPAFSVEALADPDPAADAPFREAVQPFLVGNTHPDVTARETETYFALGLRGLADEIGMDAALEVLRTNGRKAFCPVSIMERYLQRNRFDCVVATTSPRYELALLRAARRVGIPSLAVSDLFLLNERNWILAQPYAEHLTVLTWTLKQELIRSGLVGTEIHVTGNPVFDGLVAAEGEDAKRARLRAELGLTGRKVILWPSPAVTRTALYDRALLTPEQLTAAFEPFCCANPEFAYLLRPHPNTPYAMPDGADHGVLDPGLSAEDALLVADVVCVELSTMGLQAALRGLPVICVGFSAEAVYPGYGLAHSVDTLDDALRLLARRGDLAPPANQVLPPLGTATQAILDVMRKMMT